MNSPAQFLLTVGGILLIGLLTSAIGRRTPLPRVTLLLLFGVLIGSSGLNMIPPLFLGYFDLVTDLALLMIGFLLGSKMSVTVLRASGLAAIGISLGAAIVALSLVSVILVALGVPFQLALLFGCLAAATDPTAVYDVADEVQGSTPFSDLLLNVVALDDAWALIFFSMGAAFIASFSGAGYAAPLMSGLWEIGGGVAVGVVIGLPAACLTGRVKQGEPILTEALGLVFVCGGLALWLDVSFLIAAMVMGGVVAVLGRHHEYRFHEIEHVEAAVMVVFFVLAGASLEISALGGLTVIGGGYIVSRAIGKIVGGWAGAKLSGVETAVKRWVGVALLPQAGVAIGMALVAASYFPEYRQTLLSIVIGSTVFFEIIGPVFTRLAIKQAGGRS